jgi:hypothetical protein
LEGNLERKMQQAIESATTGIQNITQKLMLPQEKSAIPHAEKDATSFPRDTIDFKTLTLQPTKRHQTDAIHMRSANLTNKKNLMKNGAVTAHQAHTRTTINNSRYPLYYHTN